MQLTSVSSPGSTSKSKGSDAPVALQPARADTARATPATSSLATASPPRGGLTQWAPQLNQQLAGAQQAIHFLDETATQLQGLKFELDGRLASKTGQASDAQAAVSERVQRLVKLWERRQTASGGTLGPDLSFASDGVSTQRFTVRGMALQHLQRGDKEMLSISARAPNSLRGTVTVALEDGLPRAEVVKRFDQALAARNVRAAEGESGALVFSAPESDWTALRESLAIRGGGIRFPTGQFHRVAVDAQPAALQPAEWKVSDAAEMRKTLQKVLHALDTVRQARHSVQGVLSREEAALRQAAPGSNEPHWAAKFVKQFEGAAQEHAYSTVSEVASALVGVRRERVVSLLTMRAE